MGKFRFFAPWLWVLILCLGGVAAYSVPGYRFSGCVLFAAAFVVVCYQLLRLLSAKKPKLARRLQRILTAVLCVFLLAYAITGVIIITAGLGDVHTEGCDYLIVLGAGVNGTTPSLSLRERLDAALAYLQQHPETVCIVSGGQGDWENITEAECMYRYLTAAGIPSQRIIKEEQATSTQENIAYSLALMTRTEQTRIGILSSEYHLCRAKRMARDQGIDPVMIPAETTWLSLRLNYYLREVAGIWYYMILGGQHHDFSFLCRPLLGTGK